MDTQEALVTAMNKAGVVDPVIRNGIMAIASAEGGFGEMKPETPYTHTNNQRIRQIFGSRVGMLNDGELNDLKSDPRRFFSWVYGAQFQNIHHLGNTLDDDGYNWRGRGPIQFTGRANYTRYSQLAGHPEVMQNPELVSDPEIGAAMTVAYILDRYHGGGFAALMQSVGNNSDDIRFRKQQAFNSYMDSHRYDADPDTRPAPLRRGSHDMEGVKRIQQALIDAGYPCGRAGVDGLWFNDTDAAMAKFQADRGLPVTRIADDATLAALGLA